MQTDTWKFDFLKIGNCKMLRIKEFIKLEKIKEVILRSKLRPRESKRVTWCHTPSPRSAAIPLHRAHVPIHRWEEIIRRAPLARVLLPADLECHMPLNPRRFLGSNFPFTQAIQVAWTPQQRGLDAPPGQGQWGASVVLSLHKSHQIYLCGAHLPLPWKTLVVTPRSQHMGRNWKLLSAKQRHSIILFPSLEI